MDLRTPFHCPATVYSVNQTRNIVKYCTWEANMYIWTFIALGSDVRHIVINSCFISGAYSHSALHYSCFPRTFTNSLLISPLSWLATPGVLMGLLFCILRPSNWKAQGYSPSYSCDFQALNARQDVLNNHHCSERKSTSSPVFQFVLFYKEVVRSGSMLSDSQSSSLTLFPSSTTSSDSQVCSPPGSTGSHLPQIESTAFGVQNICTGI